MRKVLLHHIYEDEKRRRIWFLLPFFLSFTRVSNPPSLFPPPHLLFVRVCAYLRCPQGKKRGGCTEGAFSRRRREA